MTDKVRLSIDLTPDEQKRVEAAARQRGYETPSEYVLALVSDAIRPLSARELLKLSHQERQAILKAMATEAERDYNEDRSLTDFEAFGQDDLYDETP